VCRTLVVVGCLRGEACVVERVVVRINLAKYGAGNEGLPSWAPFRPFAGVLSSPKQSRVESAAHGWVARRIAIHGLWSKNAQMDRSVDRPGRVASTFPSD